MSERERAARFSREVETYFDRQEERLSAAVSEMLTAAGTLLALRGLASGAEMEFALRETRGLLESALYDGTHDEFMAGWVDAGGQLALELDEEEMRRSEEEAEQELVAAALMAVGLIEGTTRRQVQQAVSSGLTAAGVSTTAEADDGNRATVLMLIAGFYTRCREVRTPVIVGHELKIAQEQGKFVRAGLAQAEIGPVQKAWRTQQDDQVDDPCVLNEGAGWIPLAQSFPTGDMMPPQHIFCRCRNIYRGQE